MAHILCLANSHWLIDLIWRTLAHKFDLANTRPYILSGEISPIYENMDNGQLSGIVFLDIRKAFDSIDHNILLHKLEDQFGVSDIELRWFESYLNKREQVCIVNNLMSSSKRIVSGVPQGSI